MTERVSLPFDAWPQVDRDMWLALVQDGGPLDGRGPMAHLRAGSRFALVDHYGKWLSWLTQAHPCLLSQPPETRATPQRLDAFLRSRPDYAPHSRLMVVDAILRVLHAYAPTQDWTAAHNYRKHLRQAARRATSARKQGRILSSCYLLDLAVEDFHTAPSNGETPLARAKRLRDSTLVAFLALMPIRARALAELQLGTSVQITQDAIWILLSEAMNKNAQPWEAPLPSMLRPLFDIYIGEVRPWLMARREVHHACLWVNDRGGAFEPNYLSGRVRKITKRLTGVSIPVHFFRDAAATTLARQSPTDARLIRPLLGHLNFETADRHYIQAQGIAAGRDYAAALRNIKEGR